MQLCIRDYGIRGPSVYVTVFDDRVEIENPGGLAAGVTKQSFDNSSIRRNPIIADLFHRIGNVERIGSGIGRMRDLMRKAGLKEPVFEMDGFFRVIFYRDPEYSLKQVNKNVEKGVEKSVEKMLTLIRKNPTITQLELANEVGLSRRGIEKNLSKLKASGRLIRIGSARKGYWKVLGDSFEQFGKTVEKSVEKGGQKRLVEGLVKWLVESQKTILSLIIDNPRISKQELAKEIGISTTAIDKNIDTLKKKNLLRRVGSARSGHWEVIT